MPSLAQRLWHLSLFSIALLLLVSCSSSNADNEASEAVSSLVGPSTSEFQSEILGDGVLSNDEYESAGHATQCCLEGSGFVVDLSREAETGGFEFELAWPAGIAHEKSLKLQNSCFDEF